MSEIYLDHNATTPLDPRVLEAMRPYLQDKFGNPSSVHRWGRSAKVTLYEARRQVAALLGASCKEIFFTSGGTESNNWALQGLALPGPGKHLITCATEHPSVLNTCRFLEKQGVRVTFLPVDETGRISIESLLEAVTQQTVLISVMFANNETGTLQPIGEIAPLAREKGIPLHCDAVQAAGKLPLKVKELGVDMLSLSAHKMYGPKGCGALYVKEGTPLQPILRGGGQEYGQRSGTENVASIAGFGEACALSGEELPERKSRLEELALFLKEAIEKEIGNVHLNGHPLERLPGTLNMSFLRADAEDLALNLDLEKIAVSTGAACSAGAHQSSYVLKAMGLNTARRMSAIRISLGKDNTREETVRFVKALKPIVKRLRAGISC